MRVLHVGKFYPPYRGGMETHLKVLCEEIRDTVDLSVVVANDGRERVDEVVDGIEVTRLGTLFNLSSAQVCPQLVSHIRRSRADVVHLHYPNPTAILAYFAAGAPGHLVITYHSDIVRQKVLGAAFSPFLHAAMRRSSAVIAATPNYVESSPVLRAYRDRCHVIPFGIDLDGYTKADDAAVRALRERYGPRIVLGVGRLIYYKGFEYLIRAMARVDARLLLVGEGPLREPLERLAADLGVRDRVVFLGSIGDDEILACYHASDLFVLSSIARSEAFGIVQIEAMAAGIPVVNTSLDSGVPFVSLDGVSGLTVPPCDADALADAINRILDSPELKRELGEAGRERARREFSKERMAERTLALYDDVMRGNGAR